MYARHLSCTTQQNLTIHMTRLLHNKHVCTAPIVHNTTEPHLPPSSCAALNIEAGIALTAVTAHRSSAAHTHTHTHTHTQCHHIKHFCMCSTHHLSLLRLPHRCSAVSNNCAAAHRESECLQLTQLPSQQARLHVQCIHTHII
jgi:hypothetical protein